MDLTIRRAEKNDAETIAGFNAAMARETEDKPLDPETVRRGVRAVLDRPEHGFYLVAEAGEGAETDKEIAGALLITTEWSDWRAGLFWWIQSVYVRPAWRRRGVYRALYEHVREQAGEASEVCGLRLYVERDNRAARAAYQALGMEETTYRLYEAMLR